MPHWYTEKSDDRIAFGLAIERSVCSARSEYQTVEVIDTLAFGRVLVLDGVFQTSEVDEHLYHEMLAHPALVACRAPERVLIVGGGDGGTSRQVLAHSSVRSLVLVELDALVVETCRQHMPALGAWDDSRLSVEIADGIDYVARCPGGSFDVVLVDGTDPVGPGKALFERPFLRDVARVLAPGGVFASHSHSPIASPQRCADTVAALRDTFAHCRPYVGPVPLYSSGIWSWAAASAEVDPVEIDRQRADAIATRCAYWSAEVQRGAHAMASGFSALRAAR